MYFVCLTFDFDAYSPWIYRKMHDYSNLSRGEFADVGVKRIIDLLKKESIPATFFIPGHTAEHFQETVSLMIDEGHEIANHGYMHEPPNELKSREEEFIIIKKGIETIQRLFNVRTVGYRSPSWNLSKNTIDILENLGFIYDSSLMSNDYLPYRPPKYIIIDNEGRVNKGPKSNIIELPVSWSLDDYPHFEYVRYPNFIQQGLRSVSEVFENWSLDFEYLVRNLKEGIFVITMHPEVIGRGHRMILIQKLINFIKFHEKRKETEFSSMIDVVNHYRDKLL
jgi:peptidoglycan/xylan/chitin deacetylase (PgdA/CDA1 family)